MWLPDVTWEPHYVWLNQLFLKYTFFGGYSPVQFCKWMEEEAMVGSLSFFLSFFHFPPCCCFLARQDKPLCVILYLTMVVFPLLFSV